MPVCLKSGIISILLYNIRIHNYGFRFVLAMCKLCIFFELLSFKITELLHFVSPRARFGSKLFCFFFCHFETDWDSLRQNVAPGNSYKTQQDPFWGNIEEKVNQIQAKAQIFRSIPYFQGISFKSTPQCILLLSGNIQKSLIYAKFEEELI